MTIRIGFIGMGLMGVPMTGRLLQAGFQVSIWNRNPDKCHNASLINANICTELNQLVEMSDVIMLCVTDSAAVNELVLGTEGLIHHLRPGQILVDFSSIDPTLTQNIAERLKTERQCSWLDAPVSGGVTGAESGTLVIMAGGDESTLHKVQPLLKPLAQRVTHMGPSGSGQTTKICNQMLVSCNVMVMAEVLALAEKAGVDATKIPSALAGGFADSLPLQITGQRMTHNQFDEIKWHVKTLLKDLTMAETLANNFQGNTPMANMARHLMAEHAESGLSEKDPANLIKCYR